MRRQTASMRAFEARVGRPAAEAIVESINRTGSVAAAAVDLQLNYWTLLRWVDRLRIDYRAAATLPEAV